MEQTLLPKKIISAENVSDAEVLLEKSPLHVLLCKERVARVGEEGGHIILDYGKELCGGIRIFAKYFKPRVNFTKVRVRFGESLSEVNVDVGFKNATNRHSIRDGEYNICELGETQIGKTGFRFVRIDFYSGTPVEIKSIVATNTILKKKLIGGYNGEDKRIKEIFEVAKRTVDLCSGSGVVWDGVKRDRLIWVGDLYPEVLSLTSLYGRVKALENSIDLERLKPKFDGKWFSDIPVYSMWWLACVAEYYLQTGAKEFTEKQLSCAKEVIDIFDECVTEDGDLILHKYFVDWPSIGSGDEKVGCKFITILALKKAKKMFEDFGLDVSTIERIISRLYLGDLSVNGAKQVIGLKYVATGEITDKEYATLIDGGAKGFSTFMSYFILTAIASRDKKLAIDLMKEYYGAMLDKGATTFWEDFDVDWVEGSGRIDRLPKDGEKDIHGDYGKFCYCGFRHSLCHAWSSGVIKFIEENC